MPITPPVFLRDRPYLANSFGHFSIDILNSTVPMLLALFSLSLGLSNTAIGLILALQTVVNAFLQPLFGWVADRYGTRKLGTGGVLWMAAFYALAAVSPGWQAVIFLVLIGVGSAAYHPQGAMVAGRVPVQYAATATAFFFLFGQMGLGIGPALAGGLIEQWGRPGLLLLAGLNVIAAVWLWRNPSHVLHKHETASAGAQTAQRFGSVVLLIFAFMLFTRMSVQNTVTTFLPKYLQDQGWTPGAYGIAASMLMIGSAIGAVIGGNAADRWGRRIVVAGSMFLAAIPLWIYLSTSGPTLFLMIFLIGLCTGAGFSVTVVMAQAMLPGRQGLASGLTLGFMFASGAIGAAIAGWISDQIGLAMVLQGLTFVAIISGFSALALPSTTRPESQPY